MLPENPLARCLADLNSFARDGRPMDAEKRRTHERMTGQHPG